MKRIERAAAFILLLCITLTLALPAFTVTAEEPELSLTQEGLTLSAPAGRYAWDLIWRVLPFPNTMKKQIPLPV